MNIIFRFNNKHSWHAVGRVYKIICREREMLLWTSIFFASLLQFWNLEWQSSWFIIANGKRQFPSDPMANIVYEIGCIHNRTACLRKLCSKIGYSVNWSCSLSWPGVDSPHHIQINAIVKRDIIWGINIDSIYKGEVLFSLVCTVRII